jgi:glucose-1-phosphate thymidylyltransferase
MAETLGRGFTWLDTGTHESQLEASHFIATIETSPRSKIDCLEKITLSKGGSMRHRWRLMVNI